MAGYNEGNTFFANAHSPIKGGVSGNTVGGDAFIQVQKRYRKDSDVSALRFTYSSALLEVMDFGSGKPPWKAPYAQIVMEVDVFQDGVGYVWGLTQTALARSELGIDLHDLADDIWVLDITGETRGQRAQVVDRTPRWQWDCETCGEAAYGFHTAKLKAPYTQDIDLSAIPHDARLTIYFSLTVRAVDPAPGRDQRPGVRPDPLSGEELTDDGVRFEADGLTELDVPPCDQPGLAGIACLLDTGLPPASCASDVLPDAFEKQVDQARAAVDEALLETSAKKLRKLVKKIGAKLEKADRTITKRETSKRGTKPSPSCAADVHAVLGSALDLVGTAICDPASGVLAFDAPSSENSAGRYERDVARRTRRGNQRSPHGDRRGRPRGRRRDAGSGLHTAVRERDLCRRGGRSARRHGVDRRRPRRRARRGRHADAGGAGWLRDRGLGLEHGPHDRRRRFRSVAPARHVHRGRHRGGAFRHRPRRRGRITGMR